MLGGVLEDIKNSVLPLYNSTIIFGSSFLSRDALANQLGLHTDGVRRLRFTHKRLLATETNLTWATFATLFSRIPGEWKAEAEAAARTARKERAGGFQHGWKVDH
jgi:hypothetical protein